MNAYLSEAVFGALITLLFYLLRRADQRYLQLEKRVSYLENETTLMRAQLWNEEKITRTINRAVKAALNEFKVQWLTEEKRKLEQEIEVA